MKHEYYQPQPMTICLMTISLIISGILVAIYHNRVKKINKRFIGIIWFGLGWIISLLLGVILIFSN